MDQLFSYFDRGYLPKVRAVDPMPDLDTLSDGEIQSGLNGPVAPHPVKPLDFGVGYLREASHACLIVARR